MRTKGAEAVRSLRPEDSIDGAQREFRSFHSSIRLDPEKFYELYESLSFRFSNEGAKMKKDS
jgi:hypothetical protein